MPELDWEKPRRAGRGVAVAGALVGVVLLGWLAGQSVTGGQGRSGRPGPVDEPTAGAQPEAGTLEVGTDGEGESGQASPGTFPGWLVLPHAPLVRRHGHSIVWTGTHVVVWGGARSDERHHGTGLTYLRSGASYDPVSRRWRRLPPSPLSGRLGQVAVAAGGEMVVWGARVGDAGPTGAAYDPVSLRWRALPPGPIDAARPRGAAWSGRLVVVWGEQQGRFAAAAYELATQTWHEVVDPPFAVGDAGSEAAWVDGRLLLWVPPDEGDRALLASWQPGDERWRLLRPVSRAPGPARLLAAGEYLLAWGAARGEQWALTYHVPTRVRAPLDALPLDAADEVVAGYGGDALVVWSAGDNRTWRVDPATGAVETLAASPLAPRRGVAGAAWPGGLLVWGGASDERHYSDGAVYDIAAIAAGR